MTGMPFSSRWRTVLVCGAAFLIALLLADIYAFRLLKKSIRKRQEARLTAYRAAYQTRIYPQHHGPAARLDELKGTGRIYLVQMGPHPNPYSIEDFAQWLRTKYAIDAEVLPPMQLDQAAWDPQRKQYMGELLYQQIKREHPALAANPDAYLIGFTDADIYSVYQRWSYSYTESDLRRAAVISAAEMQDVPTKGSTTDRSLAATHLRNRLRGSLLSNLGLLYWHLPYNNDPTSLLYAGSNLNLPAEDIYESDLHPARTPTGEYINYPCIYFRYSAKDGIQHLPGQIVRSWWDIDRLGRDESIEIFEMDLRRGRLDARHIDFYLPDTVPIQFQRTLIHGGWWTPLGFGISGTDNYDRWLFTQDQMAHINVYQADGSADRLVRTRFWPFLLNFDRWEDEDYSGRAFQLTWHSGTPEHFELRRFDGEVESYLPCGSNDVCFENGYRNVQGAQLIFQRDAKRRLTRLTTPNKSWINLSYGDGPAIAEITDSRGRTVHYGYNKLGQLTSVTYPSGETYYYESDKDQRLLTFTVAPNAKATPRRMLTNEYQDGRLVKQTLEGGRIYTYSYSSADQNGDRRVRVTTPEGKIYDLQITGWNSTVRETAQP